MTPRGVSDALTDWRAAERACAALGDGTPAYEMAQTAIFEARARYLDAFRCVAMDRGLPGIDAIMARGVPLTKVASLPAGEAVNVRSAMIAIQTDAADEQRLSDSDQSASDADQEESDWDMMALRASGHRPAGDTQARSSLRRLATSVKRDKNADARDEASDKRDAVLASLDDGSRKH